jgi:hypothetical protein
MERLIGIVESIVLAIPRLLYRKLVVEEHAREAARKDLRAIRDALIAAQKMETMEVATTPKWYVAREACVRAVGLASAGPDSVLRDLVRAYGAAHDDLANNWTRAGEARHEALRAAFDRAMDRVAVLSK